MEILFYFNFTYMYDQEFNVLKHLEISFAKVKFFSIYIFIQYTQTKSTLMKVRENTAIDFQM